MKTLEKLEFLLDYYQATRGIGHSTLIKKGTDNYDQPFMVLTCNSEGDPFIDVNKEDIVSIESLNRVIGKRKPMVIDNGAVIKLLYETILTIDTLQKENKQLKETIRLVDTILRQVIV